MRFRLGIPVFYLLAFAAVSAAPVIDEHGSVKPAPPQSQPPPVETKLFAGLEASATVHGEEGLDSTKGEYSVGYTTFGGSATAQLHFPEFFFEGGIGAMRLLRLKVNDLNIDMTNRVQWHLPVFARIYYKADPLFSPGIGITHLTELSMYVDGEKVPESSYHQIFLDLAAQATPQITENLRLTITAVLGLNLLPGRQHTYSVGDLLHVRFQLNVGALYRVF